MLSLKVLVNCVAIAFGYLPYYPLEVDAFWAMQAGDMDTLKKCLTYGKVRKTMLLGQAAYFNNVPAFQLLVSHGAKFNAEVVYQVCKSQNPKFTKHVDMDDAMLIGPRLLAAISVGDEDTVKALRTRASMDTLEEAAMQALLCGEEELCDTLVDVDERDPFSFMEPRATNWPRRVSQIRRQSRMCTLQQ
jgi:hypothetical protein